MSCDVGLDPNGQPYAIFGLWERWEKEKEKEGREAISLVWLDERREKWVDLEWLNFGGGGGVAILLSFLDWMEREGKEEEFWDYYNFYYKITNRPFYSYFKSYI